MKTILKKEKKIKKKKKKKNRKNAQSRIGTEDPLSIASPASYNMAVAQVEES